MSQTFKNMSQTFKKEERLCSFTAINDLVKNGAGLFNYPFKVTYLTICNPTDCVDKSYIPEERIVPYNKILISVPKRNFKRAVKRNLLKRRIRESYRRNKELLSLPQGVNVNIMFVYVGKDILEYSYIERKLKEVLVRISDAVEEKAADRSDGK